MTRLDEIRSRWAYVVGWACAEHGDAYVELSCDGPLYCTRCRAEMTIDDADAEAIVHAPADVMWLLAEVERLLK